MRPPPDGYPETVSFARRCDAYPRLVTELPNEVGGFIERSHAGYYGSANPIIFASSTFTRFDTGNVALAVSALR
jgi:hypothetical protein